MNHSKTGGVPHVDPTLSGTKKPPQQFVAEVATIAAEDVIVVPLPLLGHPRKEKTGEHWGSKGDSISNKLRA